MRSTHFLPLLSLSMFVVALPPNYSFLALTTLHSCVIYPVFFQFLIAELADTAADCNVTVCV